MTTPSDLDAFAHDHVFLGAGHDDNARRTMWVVVLTAVTMLGEIAAGYWTGSMALLADGFHMATHAGALGVAAAAYAYAKRHASNRRFTFGTGKVGDLAGFASALVLGLVALGIGVESIRRLFEPSSVAFTAATIIAVVGLAVNVVSALLLSGGHGHGHGHAAARPASVLVAGDRIQADRRHVPAEAYMWRTRLTASVAAAVFVRLALVVGGHVPGRVAGRTWASRRSFCVLSVQVLQLIHPAVRIVRVVCKVFEYGKRPRAVHGCGARLQVREAP